MHRKVKWILSLAVVLLLLALAAPWMVRAYWAVRTSNPVRRGLHTASKLGCFSCHGELGQRGLPDPGVANLRVPSWTSLAKARSPRTASDIRDAISKGSYPPYDDPAIEMPAYGDFLHGSDLDDLVASFKVLSGKNVPAAASDARRGLDLALEWRCFQCHGFAGSGGLSNPGSLSGFVPGWYGSAFDDLVRSRREFDEWIREGAVARLDDHLIASYFTRRQRVSMPAYGELSLADLDDLWAYVRWLGATGGGVDIERASGSRRRSGS
jgi:mono/diheme cytochrome c family protein